MIGFTVGTGCAVTARQIFSANKDLQYEKLFHQYK